MSVSAFDPSTWGDDEHAANEALYEPGGVLGPEVDVVALRAELADLRDLERSTQAQLDKASATVTAAKVELSRLQQRIAEVEEDLADYPDDAGSEA